MGSRDSLVLVLTAYGFAEDAVPYLLEADFAVREGRDHRLAVRDLLEAVAGAGAGPKLVVLDVFPLALDPRTGSLDLEFPRLLANVMREMTTTTTRDPLWVLLSSRAGEMPQVSYVEHDSLFGRALRDGLDGYADLPQCLGNDDRRVSIGELYRYVAVRCRARSGNEQTPLLLHRGRGIVVPGEEEDRTTVVVLPRRRDRSVDSPGGVAPNASATGSAARQGVSVVEGGAERAAADLGTVVGNAAARQPAAAPAAKEPVAAPPPGGARGHAPRPRTNRVAGPDRSECRGSAQDRPASTSLPRPRRAIPSTLAIARRTGEPDRFGRVRGRAARFRSTILAMDRSPARRLGPAATLGIAGRADRRNQPSKPARRTQGTPPGSRRGLDRAGRDPLARRIRRALPPGHGRRLGPNSATRRVGRTHLPALVYRTRDLVLWHARSALISSAGPGRERDRLLADFVQELETFSESLSSWWASRNLPPRSSTVESRSWSGNSGRPTCR